jgi:hypothetical protein
MFHDAVQIRGVPGVGQRVNIRDKLGLVVVEDKPHEIAANKPAPARNQ